MACRASTLLSSPTAVSESEGEGEGRGVQRVDDGGEGRVAARGAVEAEWERRTSRDWVASSTPELTGSAERESSVDAESSSSPMAGAGVSDDKEELVRSSEPG
jgi:hypothetical protein